MTVPRHGNTGATDSERASLPFQQQRLREIEAKIDAFDPEHVEYARIIAAGVHSAHGRERFGKQFARTRKAALTRMRKVVQLLVATNTRLQREVRLGPKEQTWLLPGEGLEQIVASVSAATEWARARETDLRRQKFTDFFRPPFVAARADAINFLHGNIGLDHWDIGLLIAIIEKTGDAFVEGQPIHLDRPHDLRLIEANANAAKQALSKFNKRIRTEVPA